MHIVAALLPVIGEQRGDLLMLQDAPEKLACDIGLKQAVAFLEKVEWSHTGSSIPSPTNQRNIRS
jgi:hypothetical protein